MNELNASTALPQLAEIVASNPGWLDEAVNEKEASRISGVPVATLRTQRVRGRDAIPFLKFGRSVRYRRRDILDYMAARVRRSTSDPGPKAAP